MRGKNTEAAAVNVHGNVFSMCVHLDAFYWSNHLRFWQPKSQGHEPLERKISASRQCPAASHLSPHTHSLGNNQTGIMLVSHRCQEVKGWMLFGTLFTCK